MTVRRSWPIIAAVSVAALGSPAQAMPTGSMRFDIPSLPLVDALERFSSVTGISVGGDLPDARIRTTPVRGRLSAAEALQRMLNGTGWRSVLQSERVFRLVRAARITKAHVVPRPVQSFADAPAQDIVVTAGKRALPRWAAAGSVEVVDFASPLSVSGTSRNASVLSEQIPTLSSTALGPGRNKLFVRGVADSSLSGEAQATLGEYIGENRINYNGPDPGLLLYDVRRVELLKGPQGTLYGAGTLGGVLRIEPERPVLGRWSGAMDWSGSTTRAGAPGTSTAVTLNLPLERDVVAVRAVGYWQIDGGFVDDDLRGRNDVNRSRTTGGRADLRIDAGGFIMDVLGTHQAIRNRDSQYASNYGADPSRRTHVAEPSRTDFSLVAFEVRGSVSGMDLVSATSAQHTSLSASYDATSLLSSPAVFTEDRRISAVSHETRLSQSRADGSGWVAGFSGLLQTQNRARDLPGYDDPYFTNGFDDRLLDTALFGQFGWRRGRLLITPGARLAYSRLVIRSDDVEPLLSPSRRGLNSLRLLPMMQISWQASDDLTLSLGYREGFRQAGGEVRYLTLQTVTDGVSQQISGNLLRRFDPDTLRVVSTAIGYRSKSERPVAIDASLSGMRWSDIQADRIDDDFGRAPIGFIRTENSGRILLLNFDTSASWQVTSQMTIRSGASVVVSRGGNDGGLSGLQDLASIPRIAAFSDVRWSKALGNNWQAQFEARMSYRGRSRLGPGALRSVAQGDVATSALGMSMARDRYRVSLMADNLLDNRGKVFGYGNPFTVFTQGQATLQRPRTLTLSFRVTL